MMYPWFHVGSLVLYAAATATVLAYSVPKARAEALPAARLARAARAMKLYDPFSIAILGVMVMTGAFALTGYKEALRERFFQQMGVVLTWKLGFTFLLVVVGSYLAFGLGNRLVGQSESSEAPSAESVAATLMRIQITAGLVLVLCAIISWIATGMR